MAHFRAMILFVLALAVGNFVGVGGEVCERNYFVNNSECVPCGSGLESDGADTSGGDTNCTDIDGCVNHTCAGLCFDDAQYAYDAYSCEFFYINGYCANAGIGPDWNDAWSFDDYRNPDNNLSPLEACCDCGGGTGRYFNDSDRDAQCVDIQAPNNGFNCSCSPGWQFNASLQACRPVLCDKDFFVNSSECVPCVQGQTHPSDTPAIYGDTQCFNKTCGANEFVQNNSCVACAPGYSNAAGDNAFGPDTTCEVWICEENERVLNKSCIACGYGGVNPAGDNATGNNTECYFHLCELDQYVVDGQCTDCPPGTFMDERIGSYTKGINCTIGYCDLHQYVSNHTCIDCDNSTGFQKYNPYNDDMSGDDTSCGTYCRIPDIPLPHAGYLIVDRDEFPEEMVPLASSARVECDPTIAYLESGDFHEIYCSYAAGFVEYNVEDYLVCGNLDYCEGNELCASTWGDPGAQCIDRDIPFTGYDCKCNRTGFSSRTLRVNDPFDSSFVQNFSARMETVEGAGNDVVVACAYTVCAENEHVHNGECVACVPGSINPAGDTTHTGDTECEHIYCSVNEHVVNHTCKPCNTTLGLYNANLDDSTEPDTNCTPRICTGRYFVESHDCVACPPGQFNPWTNYSDENDGNCSNFDACAAFIANSSMPCQENGDLLAQCIDHPAPDDNRTCICSAGWQNISMVTLPDRSPHKYNASSITDPSFASATSAGDEWGQFASDPFYTDVIYTTCLPQLCQYDEHVVNQTCVPCAPGTTRAAGDDASIPFDRGGNTECTVVVCEIDQYVLNHTYALAQGFDNVDFCQPCPPGSSRDSRDNATLANGTACTPTICGSGKQVINHQCEACAPGTSNEVGGYNAMVHEDKECDHIFCEEDQYVLAHTCFDCAPGRYNEAGDDAAGSKTECPPIICEQNFHVLPFHVCSPCEVGTTREAGDDASKSATYCDQCSDVVNSACMECNSSVECTRCAPGYHLVYDEEFDMITCEPTICGIDERVENYECVACTNSKTNAGGDFAPLNTTECDEVYTVEFNDTYARCSVSEDCAIDVSLTYAPLSNVTIDFSNMAAPSRGRRVQASALVFEDSSERMVFSPDNYRVPQQLRFRLPDVGFCGEDTEWQFTATTLSVEMDSLDHHYNSSQNMDPMSAAGLSIAVRCYEQPRIDGFDPPASHMQGGDRISILGDGFRESMSVWFSAENDVSGVWGVCDEVVVVSDNEARCTLPSSQYGNATVYISINTTVDVLSVTSTDPASNNNQFVQYFFEHRCLSGNDLVVLANATANVPAQEMCMPCSVRSFSPYGIQCAPCPAGTECSSVIEVLEGTFVSGSDIPAQDENQFREKHDTNVFGLPNSTFFTQPVGGGGCVEVNAADGLTCDDLVLRSGGNVFCHVLEQNGRDCSGCVCGAAVNQLTYHAANDITSCIDGDFNFEERPIVDCEWPGDRCIGGSACAHGYRNSSWLCSGCEEGFAMFQGRCWTCSGGWLFMPQVNIIVLAVVLVLFLGGIGLNRWHLSSSLRDLKKLQAGVPDDGSSLSPASLSSVSVQTAGVGVAGKKRARVVPMNIIPESKSQGVEQRDGDTVAVSSSTAKEEKVEQEIEFDSEESRTMQRRAKRVAFERGKMQEKLVKLGGRAWEKFLKPEDSDRYDVMRLRLVVQLHGKIAERLRWSFVIVKLLVNHCQYIGQMNSLLGLRPLVWPVVFSIFVHAFGWVDLHMYILPAISCFYPRAAVEDIVGSLDSAATVGVQDSFVTVFLHPDIWFYRALALCVALLAIILVAVSLASLCKVGTRRVSEAERIAAAKDAARLGLPEPLSEKAAAQREARWSGLLWVTMLFYVPVSRTAMSVLSCVEYGDTYWLMADSSMQCYTTPYWVALGVSLVVLCAFTVAVPIVAVMKVHKNRASLALSETSRWLGLLYFEYRPTHYWWDGVEYAQRFLMLVCVPALVAPGSPWLSALQLVLALLFFVLHASTSPYKEGFLNRVKGASLLVIVLNHFWSCLLLFLPTIMGTDVAAVNEFGPDVGQSYLEYYASGWAGREGISVVFDIVLLAPNLAVLVYLIFADQVETCHKSHVLAMKRRSIITAEKRRLKKEAEDLKDKPWARPSKTAAAKAAAKLAELGVGADGVEDGSVGKVVESCSTQTDPEPSFEHAMDILKKENIELFEKGRALQATYRTLSKKLTAARANASNVAPDLEWRRQKIVDLQAELAAVEAKNEKLAFQKRKMAVDEHAGEHGGERAAISTEVHKDL